ncbi:hypothetical protein GQ53DRAFT_733723 [Thozetella sp. PMI_491]|nr:hypothetical protein GQ53DRAFT_733723 [Thozetella sp. PMI_491]
MTRLNYRSIVFVHGLTGNRESTWTDNESNIFWPVAFLSKDISQARILSFGYDADFAHFLAATSTNRIGEHANNLANELAQIRETTDSAERAILFVAHSLGGLVVEDALLAAKDNSEKYIRKLVQYVRGIIFLGTPHLGTDKAKWASLLANFASIVEKANTGLPGVLKPDSEVLARINSEFHQMVSIRIQERRAPIWIKCFFEEYPYKGVLIVPKQSAALLGYNPQGISANHVEMCKFESVENPGYQAIKFQLLLWLKEIIEIRQSTASLVTNSNENNRILESKQIDAGKGGSEIGGKSVLIGSVFARRDNLFNFS